MPSIEILTEAHIDGVHTLEELCFFEPWSQKSLELLCADGAFGVVALEDTEVLAYGGMTYVLDEGAITNIAVHPNHRRKGLGREIVKKLLSEGKDRGLDCIFLEVRESNTAARELYLSEGFLECGIRKNFYRHPTENGVQMMYRIGEEETEDKNDSSRN